jgi:hypothetical protein
MLRVTLAVLIGAGPVPTTSTTASVFEWLCPWLILNSDLLFFWGMRFALKGASREKGLAPSPRLISAQGAVAEKKQIEAVSGLQSDNPAEKPGAGRTEMDAGR